MIDRAVERHLAPQFHMSTPPRCEVCSACLIDRGGVSYTTLREAGDREGHRSARVYTCVSHYCRARAATIATWKLYGMPPPDISWGVLDDCAASLAYSMSTAGWIRPKEKPNGPS